VRETFLRYRIPLTHKQTMNLIRREHLGTREMKHVEAVEEELKKTAAEAKSRRRRKKNPGTPPPTVVF
jgi:predicted RNase H-like nuclease (RuvC/YqgF family)